MKSKQQLTGDKWRYDFSLKGCDRVIMYIEPFDNVSITDWSLDKTALEEKHTPPYLVFRIYAQTEEAFSFWIELEHKDDNAEGPFFKLVIVEHFIYHQEYYTEEYKNFLATFPDWSYTTDWFAALESFIF